VAVLDGAHLVAASLEHACRPLDVAVSSSGLEDPEIRGLVKVLNGLRPLIVSDALFKRLSTVETPTGILATIGIPEPQQAPDAGTASILLEDIQDPGNVGAILRSAAAAGVKQVLLSRASAQAWSPRVLRAGMGAHFALRIHERCELAEFARGFHGRLFVTSQRATVTLFDADLTGVVAFAFGSEGQGLTPELAAAGEAVAIPMAPGVESLNVGAAAAVCLYERVRQLRGGNA
jgi:TrmH family RNA methyltransferase